MGYRGDDYALFLKIVLSEPKAVPRVRDELLSLLTLSSLSDQTPRVFEKGECDFRDLFQGPIPTFESNIPYILRFMIDTKASCFCSSELEWSSRGLAQIVGMNWIEVAAGKYKLLSGKDKKSHCQIELSVRYASSYSIQFVTELRLDGTN